MNGNLDSLADLLLLVTFSKIFITPEVYPSKVKVKVKGEQESATDYIFNSCSNMVL